LGTSEFNPKSKIDRAIASYEIFSDWGFSRQGWRNNQRGEYWVVAQAILIVGFVVLPVYRPVNLPLDKFVNLSIAALLGLAALVLLAKGLLDLGQQLTPLPYPKDNGQLVQTGIYSIVRHPVYSGLILAALSWAIFFVSLSHLVAAAILFVFLDAKASHEEGWLTQKYPRLRRLSATSQKADSLALLSEPKPVEGITLCLPL
jgi:protein-S-isoprenylcysteine O-methyltransferase Ste14